ncbi:MAG: pilus assembly protein PilO [Actinomycetota bacterium]
MGIHRLIFLEALEKAGKPGLAGALLLVTSLGYGLAVVLPAREHALALREQISQAKAKLARMREAPAGAPSEGVQKAFYQSLPTQAEVPQWVERIYEKAAAEQLSLVRGEYVLAPVADTRLVRYQIFLPVKGDYVRIQHFVAAALAAVPGLGLEDLSLQRQSVGDSQVEALVRFSLYLAKS